MFGSQTPGLALSPSKSLCVLFEDDHCLVIDKPAGLLVHRTALDAREHDTVLARLQGQRPDSSQALHGPSGASSLSPVHRLDKGTSGLLMLARHREAARALGQAFETGRVRKTYLALVRGWPSADSGVIDHPLAHDPERPSAGQPHREARTHFLVLHRYEWAFQVDPRFPRARYALVLAQPQTGRRHQIRRHFKHIGHPLIGDSTHGKGSHNRAVADWLGVSRLWLHACGLTVPHPHDERPLRLLAPPGPQWSALEPAAGQGFDLEALHERPWA